ncbi:MULTISPECIES: YwqJ-related putative deaminase [unclassified Streptomyces]|uniref:YwqJ-related putative deaminase n=1 Tax=unclassified Streptomyces TaxID=2593676 RepID=UPI00099BBE21
MLAGSTPVLVHNCGESAVEAAQGVADASASIRPSAARPAVAEAIRLPSGRVIASASVRGVQVRLHPAVSAVLSTVAPGARGVGHGKCGLAVCISQALFTGESPMGADAAAVIIRGNVEHPKHGFPVGPCDSCRSLSEHFKLNFVTDD